MQNVIGIDVSKETLAVCYSSEGKDQHLEVSNNTAGFRQLIRRCGTIGSMLAFVFLILSALSKMKPLI